VRRAVLAEFVRSRRVDYGLSVRLWSLVEMLVASLVMEGRDGAGMSFLTGSFSLVKKVYCIWYAGGIYERKDDSRSEWVGLHSEAREKR